MSSLYTPVFFPPPPKHKPKHPTPSPHIPALTPSTSTSTSTPAPSNAKDKLSSHTLRLSSIHLALSRLSPVLCPPSPPRTYSHPLSDPRAQPQATATEERVERMRQQVLDAVKLAEGDRSNGKWGQISRLLRLACTQGRWSYEEVLRAEGERAGGGGGGTEVRWVLPDTEEEWEELERERNQNKKRAGEEVVQDIEEKDDMEVEQEDEVPLVLDSARSSEDALLARVKRWQQELSTADARPPASCPPRSLPPTPTHAPTPKASTSKPRPANLQSKSKAKAKGTPETTKKANANPTAVARDPKDPSPLGFPVVKRASVTSVSSKPGPAQEEKKKEKGPSKPHNEDAVSPHKATHVDAEAAPPVRPSSRIEDVSEMQFLPPSFPLNMPTSTPHANARKPPPIAPSSPLSSPPLSMPPPQISPERPAKRARESILDVVMPADVFRETPPTKRARLTPPAPAPEPSTPSRQQLPTLTELLASSKGPRKAATTPTAFPFLPAPAKQFTNNRAEPPRTPGPSPTKSMFSFASASTASPGNYAPLRSPSSPSRSLAFTQNPELFAPDAVSSQPGGSVGFGLAAGSSGFISGTGGLYNSQFDADVAAGRASALLERDVEFDMWLRPEEGSEEGETQGKGESQV